MNLDVFALFKFYRQATNRIAGITDEAAAFLGGFFPTWPRESIAMELIRVGEAPTLENSGITSRQLLFPENSRSTRITVTRVTMPAGGRNPPHRHASSEQVWIALRGEGRLILDDNRTISFGSGDVVRFEDNETHGFENTGASDFEYISITSPPLNFRGAYERTWPAGNDA